MILNGDLVEQEVDAIVNAANNQLVLGAALRARFAGAAAPRYSSNAMRMDRSKLVRPRLPVVETCPHAT